MPGFEVFGKEEQEAINELFEKNGGILLAHGFDGLRNGIYRVREFENAFAERMEVPYAQAVSSGSTALKVALQALDVQSGDEVITQAFTFVATVEAILEVGATPVIVDIDDTLNMCPQRLEAAITEKTKAIIPVHMMGAPADMDQILEIANINKVSVLEDAAQGCGGTYKGRHLGTLGEIGTFSLDAGKTIMTGEGGMVVTSREEYFIQARAIHDHGHEYSQTLGRADEGALMPGFNYRITELQGAIGLAQLAKLDMILAQQRANKKKLRKALGNLPFEFRRILDKEGELGDTLVFYLDSKEQAHTFYQKMGDAGLGTKNLPDAIKWHFSKHWTHMFKTHHFYEDSSQTQWQASADLLERSIALPVMVNMTDERINEIAEKILKIVEEL